MELLTIEDKEKIDKWFKEKTPNLRCFCCGYGSWELAQSAFMPIIFDINSGRIHYMGGYPMIGLICKNCAHIEWFSAFLMGLKPEEITE